MNRKIAAILVAISVLCSLQLYGQASLRTSLAKPDPVNGSHVEVVEHGNAAAVVNALPAPYPSNKIRGHRILIFSNNSQNGRVLAEQAQQSFRSNFPDVPTYLIYTDPDFKVTVGNLASLEDAILMWGRVKRVFDKAVIIQENISVEEFKSVTTGTSSAETTAPVQ